MILHLFLIIFLNIPCFCTELPQEEKQWLAQYSAALRFADSAALQDLVESPYFNSGFVLTCSDFVGQERYAVDPITFLVRHCRKNKRSNLLPCVDILYNKGVPLIAPNPHDEDMTMTSFDQIRTSHEFNYLVTLLAKQQSNNKDAHALGKEILETTMQRSNLAVFLELIRRTIDPLSIISLHNTYKPNVIDQNIFDIIYVSFMKNALAYYLYENNGIWTGDDIPESCSFYPNFLIRITSFFIAKQHNILQKNQYGFTPNNLKECYVTWCRDGYPHMMSRGQGSIIFVPPMIDIDVIQNNDIVHICRSVVEAHARNIGLQAFIEMMHKKIPQENTLIKFAINTYNSNMSLPSANDKVDEKSYIMLGM